MPRLVRRAPLSERIKAYLDPADLLLWLAEELNDDTYDQWLKDWATPIGIALNVVFILARGASTTGGQVRHGDDVFGDLDSRSGSGWFAWLAAFLVQVLTLFCCLNAFYTFFRKRNYRLFEQPVDIAPATPSAHRVKVDSSPMSASPLRYLQHVISSATASSRAYPDAERQVWELSVWDPKPFNLTVFTLFSPGHVLLYFSLLPPTPLDPRPSVTVLKAIAYGALLSLQLIFLKASFSQQSKDATLVQGEVLNEYDTKFVRPSLNRPVRDVAIQTRESATSPRGVRTREVDIYTPTTIVNRGFRVKPNPNYAKQYDPYHLSTPEEGPARQPPPPLGRTPSVTTPTNGTVQSSYFQPGTASSAAGPDFSSPLKPHHERLRERSPQKGDGGSLGVYSHAASPLRKAASTNHLRPNGSADGAGGRVGSPLKRTSTPGSSGLGVNGSGASARRRETGRF